MTVDGSTGGPADLDLAVAGAYQRLLALVPVHDRIRDGQTGGTVAGLLRAVAGELAVLEADLDRLADAWFVETCEEWLVPYLADLVGLPSVPPDLGVTVSRRALVANTVAYRRRKGTVAVLEQVARDVTGWSTRAVEHHPLLATTTHVKAPRPDRPATASLWPAAQVELGAVVSPPGPRGVLDPLPRLGEVRRIAAGRGRWNIRNVGLFVIGVQAHEVGAPRVRPVPSGTRGGWGRARAGADPATGGYTVDPLGRDVPLLAPGAPETGIEHLAGEEDLPVPLRPRRLLALLRAARAAGASPDTLPVGVRVGDGGTDLPPDRVRVCRLEDLLTSTDPGVVVDPQVMVDPVAGRVHVYRAGARVDAGAVHVRYAYGGVVDVGAGTHDRAAVHKALLDSDVYTPAHAHDTPAAGQVHVVADPDDPAAPEGSVVDVAGGLTAAAAAWARPGKPARGSTFVVSVGDSATYTGDVEVTVPAATRLVLVAATWPVRRLPDGEVQAPVPGRYVADGVRPHLVGDVRVTGGPGSSVVLDGLLVEGDVVVRRGDLGALTVSHATVTGLVRVEADDCDPADRGNGAAALRVHRSIVGGVAVVPTVPFVAVAESVVDAVAEAVPGRPPAGVGRAISAPGAQVCVTGSTVRGDVGARTLDATSSILDGRVAVEHRQVGCVRFSYVGPDSSTPRRFRSVAGETTGGHPPAPAYASTDPASPAYLALDRSCHASIRTGGEGESEMGVHHHLRRPLRLAAALQQVEAYVPAGIEIGIFGT